MKMFTPMHKVLKPGEVGKARLEVFTITESQARLEMVLHSRERVAAGRYVRLFSNGYQQMPTMSDTPHEQITNSGVVWKARGDVFIGGLGIGMILVPILAKPEVKSVTVVEKDPDVIKLVGAQLKHKKLKIVEGDVFTWSPPPDARWDTIYFDIWTELSTDQLPEMAKLHHRYARRKRPGGWMGSWRQDEMRDRRREEREQERYWR